MCKSIYSTEIIKNESAEIQSNKNEEAENHIKNSIIKEPQEYSNNLTNKNLNHNRTSKKKENKILIDSPQLVKQSKKKVKKLKNNDPDFPKKPAGAYIKFFQ
jgi:hypothetical protein